VRRSGFKTTERGAIELRRTSIWLWEPSNSTLRRLRIGHGQGGRRTVQTASGERSGIITSEEVGEPHGDDRDFATLVSLLRAWWTVRTAEVQGFSGGASFNVGGIAPMETASRSTAGRSRTATAATATISSVWTRSGSAHRDQQLPGGVSGVKPGAGIMAVTKGGTKAFHAPLTGITGTMDERQPVFQQPPGPAADASPRANAGLQYRRPVYIPGKFNSGKNKLFFFASQEIIRERRPQDIRNLTVPPPPRSRAISAAA